MSPQMGLAEADRRIEELGVAPLPFEAARVARVPEVGEGDPVGLGDLVAGGEGGELLAQVVDEGGEDHPAAAGAEADEDVREGPIQCDHRGRGRPPPASPARPRRAGRILRRGAPARQGHVAGPGIERMLGPPDGAEGEIVSGPASTSATAASAWSGSRATSVGWCRERASRIWAMGNGMERSYKTDAQRRPRTLAVDQRDRHLAAAVLADQASPAPRRPGPRDRGRPGAALR